MSLAVLGSAAAPVRALHLTECAPVALQRLWNADPGTTPLCAGRLADVVDVVSGAILLGNASEVLLPAKVALAVQNQCRDARQEGAAPTVAWEDWTTAVEDRKIRLLISPDELDTVLSHYPCFRQFCVLVPGGPLVSRLSLGVSMQTFYSDIVPGLRRRFAAASERGGKPITWHAWMRSALTCQYEGLFVPPIRVSDCSAELLSCTTEGGADRVIWEEGVCGLTPRWLETAMKTALACGVSTSSLSLALCARPPHEPQALIAKAVDMGLSRFCTCSAEGVALFPNTASLTPLNDLNRFTHSWNQSLDLNRNDAAVAPDAEDDMSVQLNCCDDYVKQVTRLGGCAVPEARP